MNDYISKEAVIKEQQRFCGYLDNDMLNRLEIAIKRIPSANAVGCQNTAKYFEIEHNAA